MAPLLQTPGIQVTELFDQLRDGFLSIDPVAFCEKYLTLDGKPFRLNGNGYKPFADIYRYIGIKALERDSKPVVLVKGRQVGATTMAAALELFFMTSGTFGVGGRPPMRIIHAFPLLELSTKYTKTKLNNIIKTAVRDQSSSSKKRVSIIESKIDKAAASNDSLIYKQFEYGNHIMIESVGLDGDRIRSLTADGIFFDEVQDTPGIALANSIKVLSKAQWGRTSKGLQAYFGTPKGRGSDYWKIWQASSQQYYHLGCEECGKHFPLYTPGSDQWEDIWIEDNLPETHESHGFVVKCVHCGHEQDKRPAAERGKWVTTKPAPDECEFIGYHINQLYMPTFRRSDIIAEKPENNAINTERAYQNEVLGEFFAGDASPLTPDELRLSCADPDRRFRGQISMSEGKKVYLGCDWGLKVDIDQLQVGDKARRQQGQSYSSVVVLSAEGPLLQIEFARLLKQNDLQHKRDVVEEMMRRYSISLAVGDIGYAGDLTELLQKDYGDRFLMSRAVGSIKHHAKYVTDEFPKGINFERNFYIAELYDMLKKGKIRFPYGDYEQVGWLIQHCCSMEIKPSVDRTGNATFNYVKGSTPNDGFMALLNAYLAYKFDITNGFNIIHPNYMRDDPNKHQPISAITGYLPGLNPLKRTPNK